MTVLGILLSLPIYAAVIAGVVVSWRKRERYPRAATLSLIGFLILLLDQFFGAAVLRYLATERSNVEYFLARSFLSLAFAGALLALLVAVFYERPPEDPDLGGPRSQDRSRPDETKASPETQAGRDQAG